MDQQLASVKSCIKSCTYKNALTVQDIIMSNPLRSVGVIELEIVTLYTVACEESEHVATYEDTYTS